MSSSVLFFFSFLLSNLFINTLNSTAGENTIGFLFNQLILFSRHISQNHFSQKYDNFTVIQGILYSHFLFPFMQNHRKTQSCNTIFLFVTSVQRQGQIYLFICLFLGIPLLVSASSSQTALALWGFTRQGTFGLGTFAPFISPPLRVAKGESQTEREYATIILKTTDRLMSLYA